jgi:competence protein ComEA
MWQHIKDFLTFSRKDLSGMFVMLFLLMLLLLARIFLPQFTASHHPDFSEFERMVLAFEKAQRLALEVKQEAEKTKTPEFIRPDKEIAEIKLNPFPFDPNEMSEEAWLKLGLNVRQVRNIQNYINSGGRFRNKEDFRRIYTISDEEYEILQPYISIVEVTAPPATAVKVEDDVEKADTKIVSEPGHRQLIIDINTADSTDLLRVRGIGPVFARRIIRYREVLGGFHSAGQLLEVFGLDSARFEQISGSFAFDRAALSLIDVNSAGINDLTTHPYIDFYLAKSIVDERVKKGRLVSDADLYGIPLMHDALYQKVIPYFKFDQE